MIQIEGAKTGNRHTSNTVGLHCHCGEKKRRFN